MTGRTRFHNFTIGLAAAITTHSQVKVELLDSFKNRPTPPLKKNDTSLITALVWKFLKVVFVYRRKATKHALLQEPVTVVW